MNAPLPTLRQRIAPFVALLDARFLPLMLLAAPQSFNVYQWLLLSGAPWGFAALGAAGFESAYVGVIAWAENGTSGKQRGWIILTAVASLLFSVLVAVYVHFPAQAWWSLLHAGFPLVACLYTVTIHSAVGQVAPMVGEQEALDTLLPAPGDSPAGAPEQPAHRCDVEGCANPALVCQHECGTWVCKAHKGTHLQWKCTHNPNSRAYQGSSNGHLQRGMHS